MSALSLSQVTPSALSNRQRRASPTTQTILELSSLESKPEPQVKTSFTFCIQVTAVTLSHLEDQSTLKRIPIACDLISWLRNCGNYLPWPGCPALAALSVCRSCGLSALCPRPLDDIYYINRTIQTRGNENLESWDCWVQSHSHLMLQNTASLTQVAVFAVDALVTSMPQQHPSPIASLLHWLGHELQELQYKICLISKFLV